MPNAPTSGNLRYNVMAMIEYSLICKIKNKESTRTLSINQ